MLVAEHKRRRYLSASELKRLGEALKLAEERNLVSPFALGAIRLLLFTGARLSEVLTLRWEHVDRERSSLQLTNNSLEIIEAVNRHVNRSIAPRRDLDHWGKIDQWDLPTDGEGDCEDYQLLKRKLLVEAGLPRRAMRMTVVIDVTGQGHAVLTIRTGPTRCWV